MQKTYFSQNTTLNEAPTTQICRMKQHLKTSPKVVSIKGVKVTYSLGTIRLEQK